MIWQNVHGFKFKLTSKLFARISLWVAWGIGRVQVTHVDEVSIVGIWHKKTGPKAGLKDEKLSDRFCCACGHFLSGSAYADGSTQG